MQKQHSRLAWLTAVAVAVTGCAQGAQGQDFTLHHDMKPAKDYLLPNDFTAGGDAAQSGNCTQIDTWPNLGPQGTYDAQNMVTYVVSGDSTMPPINALSIEDWESMGETYPKMVTYQPGDQYATCEVCTLIAVCDQNGCTNKYFAQGGTVTVTKADRNAQAGEMIATASDLTLVEWDFSTPDGGMMPNDKPVPGGSCIHINTASFDVTWPGAMPDAGAVDATPPPSDLTTAPGDGPSDGGVPQDMTAPTGDMASAFDGSISACHVVINEVQPTGIKASDEWFELYNQCATDLDITNWVVEYRSASNTGGSALYTFTPASGQTARTIKGKGYQLIVNGNGYAGSAMPDGAYTFGGLSGTGGALALYDARGNRIDSMSYQTLSAANNFTEGMPAPNPPASQSDARLPNGKDTDNNSADFQVATTPTPGAANM